MVLREQGHPARAFSARTGWYVAILMPESKEDIMAPKAVIAACNKAVQFGNWIDAGWYLDRGIMPEQWAFESACKYGHWDMLMVCHHRGIGGRVSMATYREMKAWGHTQHINLLAARDLLPEEVMVERYRNRMRADVKALSRRMMDYLMALDLGEIEDPISEIITIRDKFIRIFARTQHMDTETR